MSILIELTVTDREQEATAFVWHTHQPYLGLGTLRIRVDQTTRWLYTMCLVGIRLIEQSLVAIQMQMSHLKTTIQYWTSPCNSTGPCNNLKWLSLAVFEL